MRLHATAEVTRLMGRLVRRADSGLAQSAARNAALCVYAERSRELEDARTLHDLQQIPAVPEPQIIARQHATN